ncbi:MAG: hypothetical protein C0623_06475 [Desulfuromonas sp.]|nr:MAG: hypothetical protein C0623_06475 [Desulfuromonas sp.]
MKRFTQLSALAAFTFAFAAAPVASNIIANNMGNEPQKDNNYGFEEVQTADNSNNKSDWLEFNEVKTAKNEMNDKSDWLKFRDVKTAQSEPQKDNNYGFEEVQTAENSNDKSDWLEFNEVKTA